MSFSEDFDKRLRRICGITNDELFVTHFAGVGEGSWEGYCESCSYYEPGKAFVKIEVREDDRWGRLVSSVEYEDMGELIRAMDTIEL